MKTKLNLALAVAGLVTAVTAMVVVDSISANENLKARTSKLLTTEFQLNSWTSAEQSKIATLVKTEVGRESLEASISKSGSFVYSREALKIKTRNLFKSSVRFANSQLNTVRSPEFLPSTWTSLESTGNTAKVTVRGSFVDNVNGVEVRHPSETFHLRLVRASKGSPWLIESERVTNYNPS